MDPSLTSTVFDLHVPRGFFRRLWLLVALLAALVNAGSMVSVDPLRRLQQSRALWTSEPEVSAEDNQGFGTLGYDGHRHAWFGLGHGLILMPCDMVVSSALDVARSRVPVSDHVAQGVRIVLIAFLSQTFICGLAACFAYLLLRQLRFAHAPATLGVLSLILATTFLHYIQNCQENNLMLAMTLMGTFFSLRWFDGGAWRDAALAGAALGYSFLTRLTTLADTGGVLLCLTLMLYWRRQSLRNTARDLIHFGTGFVPGFSLFLGIERLYQYHRFWTFRGTYYSPFVEHLPSSSHRPDMFSHSLLSGVRDALWSPSNSIFLFDPLLVIALVMLAIFWQKVEPLVRAFTLGALATLAVYVFFYATYISPTGETSWGDRYTQTPVHLLCLLAVPLLWTYRERLAAAWRGAACALIAWSVVQQIASLLLIPSIEVAQEFRLGMPWSIPRRFINIWLAVTGQGASIPSVGPLPPEWQQLTLLPFQLGLRFGALKPWALACWSVLLVFALILLGRMLYQATRPSRSSLTLV